MSIFGPYNDPTSNTRVQNDGSECLLMNEHQMADSNDGYEHNKRHAVKSLH
jgi:hypothetical protein